MITMITVFYYMIFVTLLLYLNANEWLFMFSYFHIILWHLLGFFVYFMHCVPRTTKK